jgi:hypothetical protein
MDRVRPCPRPNPTSPRGVCLARRAASDLLPLGPARLGAHPACRRMQSASAHYQPIFHRSHDPGVHASRVGFLLRSCAAPAVPRRRSADGGVGLAAPIGSPPPPGSGTLPMPAISAFGLVLVATLSSSRSGARSARALRRPPRFASVWSDVVGDRPCRLALTAAGARTRPVRLPRSGRLLPGGIALGSWIGSWHGCSGTRRCPTR